MAAATPSSTSRPRRRQRGARGAGRGRAAQRARHAARARGRAPRERRARRLRVDDLGLLRHAGRDATRSRCRSCRPRTSTRRPSSPASCTATPTRELYGVEHTILRFGIPYGPRARPGGGRPRVRRQGAARRAADDRRRRLAVAPLRLRRGPRRRRRPRARAGRGRTDLQPRRRPRTRRSARSPRRSATSSATSRSSYVPGRSGDFAGAPVSGERAPSRARLDADDAVRRGRAPLRRVAPRGRGAPCPPSAPRGSRSAALARRGGARARLGRRDGGAGPRASLTLTPVDSDVDQLRHVHGDRS